MARAQVEGKSSNQGERNRCVRLLYLTVISEAYLYNLHFYMISSTVTTPKAKKKVGCPRKVEEEDDEDVYVSLRVTLHMYNQ